MKRVYMSGPPLSIFACSIKRLAVNIMLTANQLPNARKLHSWRSFRASLLLARPFPTAKIEISLRRIDTGRLFPMAELEVSGLRVDDRA